MIDKKLLIGLFALTLLGTACQKPPTREQLHQELIHLHSLAEKGDSDQAVDAGEKALKMMDIETIRDSDAILQSAEENFSFEAFDESLRIFEMARLKNPTNTRANSYLAVLTPFQHLKGVNWRVSGSDGDDDVGLAILGSYQIPQGRVDGQLVRFFFSPYKNKFTLFREAVEDVIVPLSRDLMKSVAYWETAHKDPNMNVYLYLPKMMSGVAPIRMRSADAQLASSLSLGFALYARVYALYDYGGARFDRTPEDAQTHTPKSDWEKLIRDPRFGLLTDKEFYGSLKGRYLQFAQGIDLAYAMLKQRERENRNDPSDMSQISKTSIMACSSKSDGNHVTYESYSCDKPRRMGVPYIFTFWGNELRNGNNKTTYNPPNYSYYTTTFEPTVDGLTVALDYLKQMFVGPMNVKKTCQMDDGSRYDITMWIDLPTYLQHPVEDLKQEGPLFDSHGEVRDLRDHTLHGLFPEGIPCAH